MNTTIIYIVRHAITDAHYKHTILSWTPGIVLNTEGRKQAFRVAESFKDVEFEAIISSPIARAFETATIVAQSKGMEVVRDGRFSEWNMGIWTGKNFNDIKTEYPDKFKIWRQTPHLLHVEMGETLQKVANRMYDGLTHWAERYRGKTILIASHKDPIRALFSQILNNGVEHMKTFDVEMASISRLKYKDNKFVLDLLNLVPWKPLEVTE